MTLGHARPRKKIPKNIFVFIGGAVTRDTRDSLLGESEKVDLIGIV